MSLKKLHLVHRELDGCRACPDMIGPVVHGPAIRTKLFLLGQAPGPHEGKIGRPFAWTAGKTMFAWFQDALGIDEETFRAHIYMAAVARCFPGKAKGGGDRKPSPEEIDRCKPFIAREVAALAPELVIAVGQLAIGEILGARAKDKKLVDLVGHIERVRWHDHDVDVIALPHPSGASPWHRIEPGQTLLAKAMRLIAKHPVTRATFERAD
jgi:uracil-DNA glycosylase